MQLIPAACVLVNYHMSIHPPDNASDDVILRLSLIRLAITLLIVAALILIRRKMDVMDESAKQIIDRADALSFRWFFIYSGAVVLGVSMVVDSVRIIGYLIAGGFLAAAIFRAMIVHILDSRGMM